MPYITDKFTVYPCGATITILSMAIRLTDEYTGGEPIGRLRVTADNSETAVKNLSGYYCFTGLSVGIHKVTIESDWYFTSEKDVDISALDPKNPVVEIEIRPKPSYPFPGHATLVRGLISNTQPVVNAEIEAAGKTTKTVTDEKGEFVLYFKGIKQENITVEIKKDMNTKAINTIIKEGETSFIGVVHFP